MNLLLKIFGIKYSKTVEETSTLILIDLNYIQWCIYCELLGVITHNKTYFLAGILFLMIELLRILLKNK